MLLEINQKELESIIIALSNHVIRSPEPLASRYRQLEDRLKDEAPKDWLLQIARGERS